MADVKPRANGNPNYVNQNYTATVVDAVGVQILPHVKTFGARGTTAKWGYDKNGLIVEIGWSKKMDLYRIINDTTKPISARVEAIDTRAISLVTDAKTYMATYAAYADAQKEIDELYSLIPTLFALTGQPILAGGAKLLSKAFKPEDYKVLMQQLQKKVIHLEGEIKGLEVLKSNLTGEYSKFDKVVNDGDRSANLADSWIWILIAVVLLFILNRMRRK